MTTNLTNHCDITTLGITQGTTTRKGHKVTKLVVKKHGVEKFCDIQVGDSLTATIWTDTECFEVIGATEHTLTLRTMKKHGDVLRKDSLWVGYRTNVPNKEGRITKVRRNKDGYFRTKSTKRILRPSEYYNGMPISKFDKGF